MARKRKVYVKLSKVHHGHNEPFEDGWAWTNAYDAALNLIDLSPVIKAFRLGLIEPHTIEIWLIGADEKAPAPGAKPVMREGVSTWDAVKFATKGFDAGRAA